MPKDGISMEERNDEWGNGCVKDGKRCFDCGDCVDDEDDCDCCTPVSRVQSPHKVIYLQYDPEACDEITWCQDQIDPKDTTYWRDDVVRILAESVISNHKCGVYGTGNNAEQCLIASHNESCGYGKKDDCQFLGICACDACKAARSILGLKPE